MPDPNGGTKHCRNCGRPLAAGASFCRACGTKYEAPAAVAGAPVALAAQPPGSRRRNRTAIWVGLSIVLIGAGAAVAILLAGGGEASTTTVVVNGRTTTLTETTETLDTESEPTQTLAGAVEAGRYVQAGSFKTVPHAEAERERLAGEGIEVEVISSDDAAELYPGFQVLLGGPLQTGSQEASMVKRLRQNGVPSAYAREITPAAEIGGPAETAGSWSGSLDRSSGEHPNLSSLSVSLEMDSEGSAGTLEFGGSGCREDLSLSEAGPTTLTYAQGASCIGDGEILVRPSGGELMLTLLPLDTDILVLGSLSPV